MQGIFKVHCSNGGTLGGGRLTSPCPKATGGGEPCPSQSGLVKVDSLRVSGLSIRDDHFFIFSGGSKVANDL